MFRQITDRVVKTVYTDLFDGSGLVNQTMALRPTNNG